MVWSSTTHISRISSSARDATWRQICSGSFKETPVPKQTYVSNPQPWLQPLEPFERPICYFALEGHCKYGVTCTYSHDISPEKRAAHAEGKKLVCCYALQGRCKYGVTCEYSHDLTAPRPNGCSFGSRCHLGHSLPDKLLVPGAVDDDVMTAVRAHGDAAFMDCHGLSYDDTDPLWDEVSCALRGDDVDNGDADLSSSSRERLEKAGQYFLADQEISDEWICIPGVALRDGLQVAQQTIARLRQDWINDDLHEARVLWDDLVKVLERRRRLSAACSGAVSGSNSTAPLLIDPQAPGEKALDGAEARVQQLFGRANSAWSTGAAAGDLLDALKAAHKAVEELRNALADVMVQRAKHTLQLAVTAHSAQNSNQASRLLPEVSPLDDELRLEGTFAWNQLDASDKHSFKFTEFLGCLQRCVSVCQSLNCTSSPQVSEKESSAVLGRAEVGAEVQVHGFIAPAERSLNGQSGVLVKWHEAERLWQVQLQASRTRLLISDDQFTLAFPAVALPEQEMLLRGRSRSPRGAKRARSLLDLAEKAAARGDYVLIHHTVPVSE